MEIILTRSENSYPSLSERIRFINTQKPDLVISLHANFNKKKKNKSGTQIFTQSTTASKISAEKLSKKFENCIIKEQSLKLLRESEVTALLVEVGYLSNDKEREYLSSKNGQQEIAQKILDFVYEN